MKRLLASLVALMLLCTLCVPALAQTITLNLCGGMTVEIPDNWSTMISAPEGEGTILTAAYGEDEITIDNNGETPIDFNLLGKEMMETLLPEMESGFAQSGLEVQKSEVFDGGSALYFKLVSGMELMGMKVMTITYVGTHGTTSYTITGVYFGEVTAEREAAADAIVSSIQFQ